MATKKVPLGTAIPTAAHAKMLQKQYTRNMAKMKDYYCRLYVLMILILCSIAVIGFWAGYLLSVILL